MITQGLFSEITSDAVIASAKAQLRIETSDDDIWFDRLVNEAVRHLDCLSIFQKKVCKVKVQDNRAKLPNGFYRFIAIRVQSPAITEEGVEVCTQLVYADLAFINSCGCNSASNLLPFSGTFEIQGGHIFFHGGVNFTDITLAYLGLNITDDGLMKIYSDYERALIAYVCYKYTLQNFQKYTINTNNEYKQEWISQKKWIKSIDAQNHFKNTKVQMAEWMNALVVDKLWVEV